MSFYTPIDVTSLDQYGNELSDVALTWSTQGLASVGSIDETGLFNAGTQAGTYNEFLQVVATAGDQSHETSIDVTITPGPLSSIAVEPDEITLNIGAAQPFIFAAFDEFGNGIADVLAAWAMPEDVGALDGRGLFRAGTRAGTFPGAIRVDVVERSERVSATVDVSIRPDPPCHRRGAARLHLRK